KCRHRVVQIVLTIKITDIRRPKVPSERRYRSNGPFRWGFKHGRFPLPFSKVGRRPHGYSSPCSKQVIGVTMFSHHWVVYPDSGRLCVSCQATQAPANPGHYTHKIVHGNLFFDYSTTITKPP